MKFNLLGGCPTSWEIRGIWLQVSAEVTPITQRKRSRAAAIVSPGIFIIYALFGARILFSLLRRKQMDALKDTRRGCSCISKCPMAVEPLVLLFPGLGGDALFEYLA